MTDTQNYLEVHPEITQNTVYTFIKGVDEYTDLQLKNLKTARYKDTQRELQQSRNRYLRELKESKKIERGLEPNEQVNIA